MTPIHFPLSAFDRRAAMRPTRVSTESRTSLCLSVTTRKTLYAGRWREEEEEEEEQTRVWEMERVLCLRFGSELWPLN